MTFERFKTLTSNGCEMRVLCNGKHNKWMSFSLANFISLIEICDACPSCKSNTGWTGGICFKSSLLTHPDSMLLNKVPGIAPSFGLSGTHFFLGYIIIGGRHTVPRCWNTWKDHVCLPSFHSSYGVHISASQLCNYFAGLVDYVDSSFIKISMGLLIKLSRPYTEPSLPKKIIYSFPVGTNGPAIGHWEERVISLGWRRRNPSNHAQPTFPSLNGWLLLAFSAIVNAIFITVSLLIP